MLALAAWQGLLSGVGYILSWLFDLVGNYGVAIILLTVVIRFVLFPLGYKQIKSMQAMQAIQPKVKEIQKKYKGNRQKQQEETMKLYSEYGVSPLGGCLPLILQIPILATMYSVIRPPQLVPHTEPGSAVVSYYTIHNNHLPVDSALLRDVMTGTGVDFITLNLECSALQAGTNAKLFAGRSTPVVADKPIKNADGSDLPFTALSRATNDCGSGPLAKVPYFVLALAMMGTTFYQQRQMTRASPPSAQNQQQQALLKIMPLMFGVFGLFWPSGLLVYWFTSNVWQIGQQSALLRAGHIGPDALERRKKELESKPPKQGFMARMNERMTEQQKARQDSSRQQPTRRQPPRSGGARKKPPPGGRPRPGGSSRGKPGTNPGRTPGQNPKKKPGGDGGTGNGKGRPQR